SRPGVPCRVPNHWGCRATRSESLGNREVSTVFSTEPILWVQQFASPALDVFFSAITLLGTQYAYIVILVSLYWCVDRRIAHRLAMVFLASMWVNGYLKETFQTPRPSPDDGVRVLARESSFSFPSGHAQ